jgi:HlyD family secretion protein
MNRKRVLIVVVVAAALVAGIAFSSGWFHHDSSLQGSGTVEARDIRVGSKVGGRIDKVLVREGDAVQAGQVLITFDDKELQAALEQSRAAEEKARRGYRPEEIAEARAALEAAKAEYEQRRNGYRREDIAAAQADLDRTKADEVRATTHSPRKISSPSNNAIPRKPRGVSRSRKNRTPTISWRNCTTVTGRRKSRRRRAGITKP